MESDVSEQERDELCQALDIGLRQLERGEYSVYTADTIHTLVQEVTAEGRKRLDKARVK